MTQVSATAKWIHAVKLGGWPKIVVPAVFGQVVGVYINGHLDPRALMWGLAFTCLFVLYLVLLNDWGDARVDKIKRQLFPMAGSPKTLPDHLLSVRAVAGVGLAAGGLAIFIACFGAQALNRPWFAAAGLMSVAIFQAYTFRPLRLNYRGGGEFLEMLGTGLVMPWMHAYIQSAAVWHPLYSYLIGLSLLSLASALASGLSDEESDMVGGKRTFTTLFGNKRVRRLIAALVILAGVVWLVTAMYVQPYVPLWSMIPPGVVLAYQAWRLTQISPAAVTRAFAYQKQFKAHLHRGIWYSTGVLALILLGLAIRDLT